VEFGVKFTPVKPGSPHLDGKVERSQRADLDEFYETVDPKSSGLEMQLAGSQPYQNWEGGHGALGAGPLWTGSSN